jgi:hypothetical protein
LGLVLRRVTVGYVSVPGSVLKRWLSVVSGMIACCDRCGAGDPRDALIREQAQRIAALEALVADLRERLEAAERAGSRNSGNSSMPPSSDDLLGRKMPRKQRCTAERAEREKKRGKQPGSPGTSMRWEVPDRTEDHYPQGECCCRKDLAGAEDLGVTRSYQQQEVPAAPAERV